jgi:hypothetical protein
MLNSDNQIMIQIIAKQAQLIMKLLLTDTTIGMDFRN